ncbi:unnamed protein product [Victoria cruziana]
MQTPEEPSPVSSSTYNCVGFFFLVFGLAVLGLSAIHKYARMFSGTYYNTLLAFSYFICAVAIATSTFSFYRAYVAGISQQQQPSQEAATLQEERQPQLHGGEQSPPSLHDNQHHQSQDSTGASTSTASATPQQPQEQSEQASLHQQPEEGRRRRRRQQQQQQQPQQHGPLFADLQKLLRNIGGENDPQAQEMIARLSHFYTNA